MHFRVESASIYDGQRALRKKSHVYSNKSIDCLMEVDKRCAAAHLIVERQHNKSSVFLGGRRSWGSTESTKADKCSVRRHLMPIPFADQLTTLPFFSARRSLSECPFERIFVPTDQSCSVFKSLQPSRIAPEETHQRQLEQYFYLSCVLVRRISKSDLLEVLLRFLPMQTNHTDSLSAPHRSPSARVS